MIKFLVLLLFNILKDVNSINEEKALLNHIFNERKYA